MADALGEKTCGWTPYRFAFNNPLSFTDPDGNNEKMLTKGGNLFGLSGDRAGKGTG